MFSADWSIYIGKSIPVYHQSIIYRRLPPVACYACDPIDMCHNRIKGDLVHIRLKKGYVEETPATSKRSLRVILQMTTYMHRVIWYNSWRCSFVMRGVPIIMIYFTIPYIRTVVWYKFVKRWLWDACGVPIITNYFIIQHCSPIQFTKDK